MSGGVAEVYFASLNFLLGKEKTVNNVIHFLMEENMEGKMKIQNIAEVRQCGSSFIVVRHLYCLLESKSPDTTACIISCSPILLYLFRGVKNQKQTNKKRKPMLVYCLLYTEWYWQTEEIFFYSL